MVQYQQDKTIPRQYEIGFQEDTSSDNVGQAGRKIDLESYASNKEQNPPNTRWSRLTEIRTRSSRF